jgi:hypothetical protein
MSGTSNAALSTDATCCWAAVELNEALVQEDIVEDVAVAVGYEALSAFYLIYL